MGKTIQVLSLLLVLKQESNLKRLEPGSPAGSILVAPASLLANWAAEVERFAPTLKLLIAHPSFVSASDLKAVTPGTLADVDLVITSYGALLRYDWLMSTRWQVAVIDEAQAIKNPGAKQTRAVKKLIARTRVALTGTPVENRLSDGSPGRSHLGFLETGRRVRHHLPAVESKSVRKPPAKSAVKRKRPSSPR